MGRPSNAFVPLQLKSVLLISASARDALFVKFPSNVVVVAAFDNPLTKAKSRGLKKMMAADRSLAPCKVVLNRAGVDPVLVREIRVGHARVR